MKKVILLVLFIAFMKSFVSYGQSEYNDAKLLSKYAGPVPGTNDYSFKLSDSSNVAKILIKYLDSAGDSLTLQQINNEYKDNIFIKQYMINYKAVLSKGLGSETINKTEGLLSSFGSLDVTNLADGFAKFLVERTKEELATAFFNRFIEAISDSDFKDLQILFPQTYTTFNAIGEQIYNYSAYINTIRESFEKDLSGLLTQIPEVIEEGSYRQFFNSHKGLKAILLSSIYLGNGLLKKQHPGQLLADYNEGKYLYGLDIKVKAAVQTLKLFSGSIRSSSGDHFWVPADSLKLLFNNTLKLNLFLGLVYQKALKVDFGDVTLADVMVDAKNNNQINSIIDYIKGFADKSEIVTKNINILEKKSTDKNDFVYYYDYYTSVFNLINYASDPSSFPLLNKFKPDLVSDSGFQNYMRMLRLGGNIALDINRRNYSSAIINLYQLYNNAFTRLSDNESPDSMNSKVRKIKQFILKYGSFMASVVQAQNSDDVKNAIEAVVLPAGSYRIKRENQFNISLNAYVGFFGGYESLYGNQPFLNFNMNSYGITAPIGINFSKGFGGSISGFVSIIDLGAITSFRFGDDSTKKIPTVQLKNIFSPGIFFSYGVPALPLSFNFGIQIGPNLRTVNSSQNSYNSDIYWRTSFSICVDIPLLNFYTKTE